MGGGGSRDERGLSQDCLNQNCRLGTSWRHKANSVESAIIPINETRVHWFYAYIQFPSATDASPAIRIKLTESYGTPLDILHQQGHDFKKQCLKRIKSWSLEIMRGRSPGIKCEVALYASTHKTQFDGTGCCFFLFGNMICEGLGLMARVSTHLVESIRIWMEVLCWMSGDLTIELSSQQVEQAQTFLTAAMVIEQVEGTYAVQMHAEYQQLNMCTAHP